MENLKAIGSNTANLVLGTVNTTLDVANKGVETIGVVANSGLETASTVSVNSGKIVSSASGIVADTVGITADLIERIHIISENATSRQQDIELLKNSRIKEKTNVGIVKNTEGAQVDILTIQKKAENEKTQIERYAENEKKKIERDAENEMLQLIAEADKKKREIEAKADKEQIQSQLKKQLTEEENIANQKNIDESLAYGFKTDKSPYEIGSTLIEKYFDWFKKRNQIFFGYYVPIGVLNRETLEIFNIVLPTKNKGESRIQNQLICQDEKGNVVTINFRSVAKKRLFRDPEIIIQPVVTVNENGTERTISGELVFQKRSYFIYKEVAKGGKSRRQIKKHRVGYKKSQKAKTRNNTRTRNKRRT
jgi:hypothetical protein